MCSLTLGVSGGRQRPARRSTKPLLTAFIGSTILLAACGGDPVTVTADAAGAAAQIENPEADGVIDDDTDGTDPDGGDPDTTDPEADAAADPDGTEPSGDAEPTPEAEAATDTETEPEAVAEVVAEVEAAMTEEPEAVDETLDSLEAPLDDEATAVDVSDARDERELGESNTAPRNESGEPNQLDEAAALACAEVERALTALDENDLAASAASIAAASDWAAQSGSADVADWSTALASASTALDDDISTVVGFLSVCTEGGYEL